MRIGHGYDAHRFAEGTPLIIGGVTIAHSHGLAAHSDGDVAIHALCDALIGAMGWGDIGTHFPDSDYRFKGIDSRVLLREVVARLDAAGTTVGNVDLTVVAQTPRMGPHIAAMRTNLAADLHIDEASVNVKATTTERMGFTGREEGIAVHAIALVVS